MLSKRFLVLNQQAKLMYSMHSQQLRMFSVNWLLLSDWFHYRDHSRSWVYSRWLWAIWTKAICRSSGWILSASPRSAHLRAREKMSMRMCSSAEKAFLERLKSISWHLLTQKSHPRCTFLPWTTLVYGLTTYQNVLSILKVIRLFFTIFNREWSQNRWRHQKRCFWIRRYICAP